MRKQKRKDGESVENEASTSRPRFDFDRLLPHQLDALTDAYAKRLESFLRGEITIEDLMRGLRDDSAVKACNIELPEDTRPFQRLLRETYKAGFIRTTPARQSEMEARLRRKFQQLQTVTVVRGNDSQRFARAAAADFIRTIARIGYDAGTGRPRRTLNVGIVSGTTTGSVIEAASQLNWEADVGVSPADLPSRIRIFALNVCLTGPEHLHGNATVLAERLAATINAMTGRNTKGSGEQSQSENTKCALPYGLSAPLFMRVDDIEKISSEPQTYEVVRFTEPYRVRAKISDDKTLTNDFHSELGTLDESSQNKSLLDIVLLGVGEKPPANEPTSRSSSIFSSLATEYGLTLSEDIVGDLAFTAINRFGEPIPLRLSKGGSSDSFLFFSAVRPEVLREMSLDSQKAVILVAQHSPGKNKVPAIYASVRGEGKKYVSHLVIDQKTAEELDSQ